MTTARQIENDPRNYNQGRIQAHRVSAMAGDEIGVVKDEKRTRSFYKFIDGSSLTVNHTLGLVDTDWPKQMQRA